MKKVTLCLLTCLFSSIVFAQNTFPSSGNAGIRTTNPSALLEIRQEDNPSADKGLVISEENNNQKILLHLADNASGEYGYFDLGGITRLRGNGVHSSFGGALGIRTANPSALLEIRQEDDPSTDKALVISEENNSQKILLHLADNASGEYGYLTLGGNTKLRGNGQVSTFGGAVGIGTTNLRGYKLAVNGKVRAREVKVEATPWPDFVFKSEYDLSTLEEVENHIKEKGHLKDIPSAKEVKEDGIYVGEMNAKLLQKIEELTLYTIQQEKRLKKQEESINILKKENQVLKSLAEKLDEVQQEIKELKSQH